MFYINKKKLFKSFYGSWLLVASSFAATAQASFVDEIKRLDKRGAEIGVLIAGLDSGKVYFKWNEDRMLNPASCSKLFTGYAAMNRLGSNYQFQTKVYASSGSTPDLCIEGSGDPSFVMEDMYLLVQALKRKGLKEYSGKIKLDASVFDSELIPDDRTDADSERAYNSPIAGLNFNYNTITAFVNTGLNAKSGDRAQVGLDWPFSFVTVQNSVKVGKTTNVTWNKKVKGPEEIVQLGGTIELNGEEWRKPFRIVKPIRGFGEAFATTLEEQGVRAKGSVSISEGSCSGKELYSYASKPLHQVVELMNKYSNNFIADALVKAVSSSKPGSMQSGLKVIKEELKKVGIEVDQKGRKMVSGSGLTKGNLFSANDFYKLFQAVDASKQYLPEQFTSLPLAGVDGTLKRKYKKSSVEGLLRGKTGSLNGVQSLVGVYPKQGAGSSSEWVFVTILVNGGAGIPEEELAKYLNGLK